MTKPVPAYPVSRLPLERMLAIHRALQAGEYPTAIRLAREMEVSPKTIYRDIEFMRDRLQLPVHYAHGRGFQYTEEVAAFPSLQISEGELFALVVAEKALQQYRGTSFEKPLLSALKKMEQALPDTISLNLAQAEQAISFRTRVEPVADLEIFDRLARAAADRRQLRIWYRKPGQKEAQERVIDPYHLANINGEWFLFAYDHLRRDLRTFVPSRMQRVEPTGEVFERPARFSLERRLRDSFGVRSGQGDYTVVIRFSRGVADLIREKKWHQSQVLKDLRDGGVDLSLRLSGLEEILRWVLSWAGEARVIRPAELAQKVQDAARRLLGAGSHPQE